MKLLKLLVISGFLVAVSARAKAQADSVLKFSLVDAQNYAVENFYVSKNAKLEVEKAKKVVMQTTAIGLPHVTASASYTHIPGDIPTIDFSQSFVPLFEALGINTDSLNLGGPTPIASINSTTYGFTVSQLIFSGEYIVGLQASRVYKSLSEQINTKTDLQIKQQVSGTYFDILILEKNREVLSKTVENLKQNYAQSEKTGKAGMMDETDVDQIKIGLTRTDNSLRAINRQIEILYFLFKYELGINTVKNVELTENLDDLIVKNIINDTSYVFNLDENIDYQMLVTSKKLMGLSLRREKSTLLPTVSGFYQYQDKTNKPALDFTMKNIIGVSVQFPLFTSGGRLAEISQAKIDLEEAKNKQEQESERITMQAQQTINSYKSAYENYLNEKSNFELSEKVYFNSTEKFKQGMISSLDLTTVNNQYLQAQYSYSTAVQGLLNAKIALDAIFSKL